LVLGGALLFLVLFGCASPSGPGGSRRARETPRPTQRSAGESSNEPVEQPAAASSAGAASYGAEPDAIDDGAEEPEPAPESRVTLPPNPLAGKPESELERLLREDRPALGSMSIGSPNAGRLFGGVQMPNGERWNVVDGAHAWGTRETVESLVRCIDKVHEQFPDTAPIFIGHISAERGGHLSPHVSHQAGRDVDVGYYYLSGARWYGRATADPAEQDELFSILAANTVLKDVALMRRITFTTMPPNGEILTEDILAQGRWAVQRGYISAVPPLEQMVEPRFVQEAVAELGRV